MDSTSPFCVSPRWQTKARVNGEKAGADNRTERSRHSKDHYGYRIYSNYSIAVPFHHAKLLSSFSYSSFNFYICFLSVVNSLIVRTRKSSSECGSYFELPFTSYGFYPMYDGPPLKLLKENDIIGAVVSFR